MILFSVVTVCLNVGEEIEDTVRSVLEQDFDNFEYLIQDGVSSDQTVKIAESYASAFNEKGIPFRIISQHDQGLYDAMNKATQQARGEWIIFMNAGDRFADGTVLKQVGKNANLETADVVYGDVISRNNNLYLYVKARPLESMRFDKPFCHQSAFTRKSLFDSVHFSSKYRICSDYHFYLQLYYEGKKFAYIPIPVSIYDVNGLSSNSNACHKERLKIYEELQVRDEEAVQRVKNWLKEDEKKTFAYEHFWKFIPKSFRQIRRDYLRKKEGWKIEKEFFANLNQTEGKPL